ncbi:hypothetical protein IV203_034587 [Nitzschia inconspicua]|uniref:Uncharacterized protein n=1 Tax=Nitzschia inconspicua TaxID=303405 RepID=A0A9K3PWB5_9STRA|nr:hypothetical protein IV203_002646 [Nitzschia inconspicua]KAG7359489.1 hypothetical protein IV203_034587 [Nitzschia inconspicua]
MMIEDDDAKKGPANGKHGDDNHISDDIDGDVDYGEVALPTKPSPKPTVAPKSANSKPTAFTGGYSEKDVYHGVAVPTTPSPKPTVAPKSATSKPTAFTGGYSEKDVYHGVAVPTKPSPKPTVAPKSATSKPVASTGDYNEKDVYHGVAVPTTSSPKPTVAPKSATSKPVASTGDYSEKDVYHGVAVPTTPSSKPTLAPKSATSKPTASTGDVYHGVAVPTMPSPKPTAVPKRATSKPKSTEKPSLPSKGDDNDDNNGRKKDGKGKVENGSTVGGKKGPGWSNYNPPALTPSIAMNPPVYKPSGSGGGDRPTFEHEFVMVREEVGTPDPESQYRIASSIGFNGYVHDVIYDVDTKAFNATPSGIFSGRCTVTAHPAELLCTYEIALYRTSNVTASMAYHNGESYGFGAFIAHGPVIGRRNTAIVTGANFDFAIYHKGSLDFEQDPSSPVLYCSLKLYG